MPRFISFAGKAISGSEDAKEAGWTRDVKIKDSVGYDMLIQLQALNMILPGVPCIYYGDEYGDVGAGDPDNRRMARFGNQLSSKENKTLDKTIKLVQLRRNNIAMIYGETKFLQADKSLLVIMRKYFDNVAVLILNKSNDIQNATVQMPQGIDSKSLETLFSTNFEIHNNQLTIRIPPHQTEVIYSYKK
jgi:glycosidase